MHKLRTALVAGAVVLGASALSAGPAAAGTITVTTTQDGSPGGSGNPVSLREAIALANLQAGEDEVVLAAGATYQLDVCTAAEPNGIAAGDLDLAALTIVGNGATIEQTCSDERVVDAFTDTTLEDLTLTGGSEDVGAAVRVTGDTTLTEVQVVENVGDELVAGNGQPEADITIEDSVFDGTGGTPNTRAVVQNLGDVSVSGSTFRDLPTAGILAFDSGSTVTVLDSVFTGNGLGPGPGAGGGISSNAPLTVIGSTFSGNRGGNGGAIRVHDKPVTIRNSTIFGNTVDAVGAGIFSLNTDADPSDNGVTLSHVTLWGNTRGAPAVPANVETAGTLTSFASIIGQSGPGDSCVVGATVTQGGNLDRADSCGFGALSSDEEDVADIGIGAPSPGDGAGEQVLVPGFLSPAVDRISVVGCVGLIIDQVGQIRPTDGDFDTSAECDSGAVERPLLPVFTDVGTSHAFFAEIGWMAWEEISTGYLPGPQYKPAAPVTRQSMSAFLYRLAGKPAFTPPVVPTFSDVPASNPFFTEIEWMNSEGITTGFGDGTFKPAQVVSRQSMSAFMYRFDDPPGFVPPATPTFSDVPLSNPFFTEIEWMAAEEITTGFPDGTFKPSQPVTRQAMSAFMFRLASTFH